MDFFLASIFTNFHLFCTHSVTFLLTLLAIVKICSEIPTHYNSAVATTTTEISVAIILAKKQKEDPQKRYQKLISGRGFIF
jgi:hypothetical protein